MSSILYLTYYTLGKFCYQAHMWVDCRKGISRVWAIDWGHIERHILIEVLPRIVSLKNLWGIWKGSCETGSA